MPLQLFVAAPHDNMEQNPCRQIKTCRGATLSQAAGKCCSCGRLRRHVTLRSVRKHFTSTPHCPHSPLMFIPHLGGKNSLTHKPWQADRGKLISHFFKMEDYRHSVCKQTSCMTKPACWRGIACNIFKHHHHRHEQLRSLHTESVFFN